MNEDQLFRKLKVKMKLIASLPPQEIGILTPAWKKAAYIFKSNNLKVLTLSGFLTSLALWLFLGASLVSLVSLLQSGF